MKVAIGSWSDQKTTATTNKETTCGTATVS